MKTHAIAVLAALTLGATPRAWSAPRALMQQAPAKIHDSIKLKNVPPFLMARFLGPVPAVQPEIFYTRAQMEAVLRKGVSQAEIDAILNKGQSAKPTPHILDGNVWFSLPEGLESITPVDPQNALIVFGTPDSIAKLRDIVSFMDKPLHRVELESKSFTINRADLEQLTPHEQAQKLDGTAVMFFPPTSLNIPLKLRELVNSNRARPLWEARTTLINNMPAILGHSEEPFEELLDKEMMAVSPGVAAPAPLRVTATINNDESITLVGEDPLAAAPNTPAHTHAKTTFVANVRDGESIILVSSDPDPNSLQVKATFLTTRIIRNANGAK